MSLASDGGAQLEIVVPRLGELVGEVRPGDMDAPTPCAGWSVRDLLNHLVGGAQMFAEAFGGAPLRDISGRMPDVVGDDPAGAFAAAAEAFGTSAAQPGAMEREYSLPFGTMEGPTVLQFVAFDLSVHTWDLATALGRSPALPDELIDEVDQFARQALDGWPRDRVNFKDEAPAPEGADTFERLIAYTGRTP